VTASSKVGAFAKAVEGLGHSFDKELDVVGVDAYLDAIESTLGEVIPELPVRKTVRKKGSKAKSAKRPHKVSIPVTLPEMLSFLSVRGLVDRKAADLVAELADTAQIVGYDETTSRAYLKMAERLRRKVHQLLKALVGSLEGALKK